LKPSLTGRFSKKEKSSMQKNANTIVQRMTGRVTNAADKLKDKARGAAQ
jgi:hypothetical protein